MSKTRINEDRPMIPAHLLTPYSVGEVVKRTTTISGDNAAHLTVLPMRPMGKVSIEGDVELALPALLAWINPFARVEGTGWSWRAAIAESMRSHQTVDFDGLPPGVVYDRLAGDDGKIEMVIR